MTVTVIGAGLAGSEAAWQIAKRGVDVCLYDMKPEKMTDAHKNPLFCELVCSNSLRSGELTNAAGLLKEEMRRLDSLVISCADKARVDAGGALAVDRERFSELVTEKLKAHPNIDIRCEEIKEIPDEGYVIIATGPLTDGAMANAITRFLRGEEYLHFFDASSPIVTFDSIDMEKAFVQSRYDRGADYINCPMDKEEYVSFINELANAEEAPVKGFEDVKVFEGCMPIEVMARRGEDTVRFGPLKPVGLHDPNTGKEPYAAVQLRRENSEGVIWGLVGFQTHLKFGEQARVFSMIPALKNAEFVRFGVMHRNTFLNSPKLLDGFYRVKHDPRVMFAGQITGVEGYIESAASGLYAGAAMANIARGKEPVFLPPETAIGALAQHVKGAYTSDFQPMNINFGIISPLSIRKRKKREKNLALSERALDIIDGIKGVFGE